METIPVDPCIITLLLTYPPPFTPLQQANLRLHIVKYALGYESQSVCMLAILRTLADSKGVSI